MQLNTKYYITTNATIPGNAPTLITIKANTIVIVYFLFTFLKTTNHNEYTIFGF